MLKGSFVTAVALTTLLLHGCNEEPSPVISINMMADGTVELEGAHITEPVQLQHKLDELAARKPRPNIYVSMPTSDVKPPGALIDILVKTGIPRVGFVTEPQAAPNK